MQWTLLADLRPRLGQRNIDIHHLRILSHMQLQPFKFRTVPRTRNALLQAMKPWNDTYSVQESCVFAVARAEAQYVLCARGSSQTLREMKPVVLGVIPAISRIGNP